MNSLINTLGNENWVRENESEIKNLLPKTWTHMHNLNILKIGFGLKLIGIDWRSEDEFGKIMVFLEKIGIMIRQNGYQVQSSNQSIFKGI